MGPDSDIQRSEAPSAELPARLGFLITDLQDGLAREDFDHVRRVFSQIAACPADLDGIFETIQAAFSAVNRASLLVDLMLAGRPDTFSRMRLIEKCLVLGFAAQREQEVLDAIRSVPDSMVVSWEAATRMAFGKRFGKQVSLDLARVKYLGVSLAPGQLLQTADALADRIEVPKPLLDTLHARTRYPQIPRDEWERQVRTAFAIDHVTKDCVGMSGDNLRRWLGPREDALGDLRRQVDERLPGVDRSKGVLLATFHGGFSRLSVALFQNLFPNGVTVLGGGARPKAGDSRYIRVVGNERAALFQALRAVQNGKVVWIGPDAPFGNPKQSIEVLGVNVPVADGGPFVAFETRCPTMWMSLVRDGDAFSTVTAMGPVREAGEKYDMFKARWFAFYGQCIEHFLTGDPRNLSLRPHWMQYLSGSIPQTYYLGGSIPKTSQSTNLPAGPVGNAPLKGVVAGRLNLSVERRAALKGSNIARTSFDWF